MDFFEVRCGPIFRLLISSFPAFFLGLLLDRCASSGYRLLLTEFESLGFLLDRVVICSLAVFFLVVCGERGLNDDVLDLVDILFSLRFHFQLSTALQLKPAPWNGFAYSESTIISY
jgi:hypothetical protein